MRRWLLAFTLLLIACGDTASRPFGQLEAPVALALHEPSEQLFIASLGADELRVFDARARRFLTAPAVLFPLAIPTVRNPIDLAAADRYVFVLSGGDASLGFVDTHVPEGAAGPRSVDVGGFPLVLPLEMVPTDLQAFAAAWPWGADGVLADHAFVSGLDATGTAGLVLSVRPPVVEGGAIATLPVPEAMIELPGVQPASLAFDHRVAEGAGLFGPGGAPIADCRLLAIGDGRWDPEAEHEPGIWLTRTRVDVDGSLSIDPPDPAERIVIRAEVELADGSTEVRAAPVRDLTFAPLPAGEGTLAAVGEDPCATRSGRLYVVLDPAYCAGTRSCPDVAVVDLFGPAGPALAQDALTGGVALYDFPASILSVDAIAGPLSLQAWHPSRVLEDGNNQLLDSVSALALLASTNGSLYYLSGGFGPWLTGPDPGDRAASGPAFPVDAEQRAPGVRTGPVRADTLVGGSAQSVPTVDVPAGAMPADEVWQIAYQRALPGFESVGQVSDLGEDGRLEAREGTRFDRPVALVADADPRAADRLVPQPFGEVACEGFPIVAVEADSLQVDLQALENDEECLDGSLDLDVLPPLDQPWWISGETFGFIGRMDGASDEAQPTSRIFAGSTLQIAFTPPVEAPPAGAFFDLETTDGFSFFASIADELGELPASVVPFLRTGPRENRDPAWRIYVAYTGTDALGFFNPAAPDVFEFIQ